jgi:hypothetical protein
MYDIVPSAALISPGGDTGLYNIVYVNGTLTVNPTSPIQFVQQAANNPTTPIVATFTNDVAEGDLLVAVLYQLSIGGLTAVGVTDSLGNVYTKAVSNYAEANFVPPFGVGTFFIQVSIWYCFTGSSGPCTVSLLDDPGYPPNGSLLDIYEFSGATALDGFSTNSYSTPNTGTGATYDWSTGAVPVTSSDMILFAVDSCADNFVINSSYSWASAPPVGIPSNPGTPGDAAFSSNISAEVIGTFTDDNDPTDFPLFATVAVGVSFK